MSMPSSRPRFFVPTDTAGSAFSVGQELDLPPTEAHHAAHVLRLKTGAEIDLFDGRGGSASGRIVRAHHGEVTASIDEVRPAVERPLPRIHLAFAVPKGNRLDWLLEKASELGVAVLQPVRFDRSVAGGDDLSAAKRDRWLGHCIAAAKQACVDFLPEIEPPLPLDAYAATLRSVIAIYGDLTPDTRPLANVVRSLSSKTGRSLEAEGGQTLSQTIHIIVGPEGGLPDAERRTLAAAGALPVRLGPTTLRIETAAVALVAAVVAVAETSVQ